MGLTLAEFWHATPRELGLNVRAWNRRQEAERVRWDAEGERAITLAWFGEALRRQKRLQPLKSYLDHSKEGEKTLEEARIDHERLLQEMAK